MVDLGPNVFSFNLWREPWITLEEVNGGVSLVSLRDALVEADRYRAIFDPSPLVVAGVHRLLTAVLQAALRPQTNRELEKIWSAGRFPVEVVDRFGAQYEHRFDLFSPDAPFLQSADLPLQAVKNDGSKTVAYLMPDLPSGTAVTHYHHGAEDDHRLCPVCAARGLVMIPAFATSGGAGIKPSINGVPPLYVLPGGRDLFQQLAASLLTPNFQPAVAAGTRDQPWWERTPLVNHSQEIIEVGYLNSLTFAARRVRLHPETGETICTRCGQPAAVVVRTMVFEMGESRPKDAAPWLDPFAAYRMPEKDGKAPVPIRPAPGKAAWREFGGLFLKPGAQPAAARRNRSPVLRPRVLDQMADLFTDDPDAAGPEQLTRAFRCIGMRTDMKAKVFEWVDTGFEVPLKLITDQGMAGVTVDQAMTFAENCASKISEVFRGKFGGKSKKAERNSQIRMQMRERYWLSLSGEFRQFILDLDPLQPAVAYRTWVESCVRAGLMAFLEALETLPDDAATLRGKVQGEIECRTGLKYLMTKEVADE